MNQLTISANPETVGLIAGWGRFPILVAESLERQSIRVACAAIRGHACESLAEICDEFRWFGVAKMGAHQRFFRRHGVERMTMAGKLFKADLMFKGSVWLRHLPDLTAIRTVGPHFITRRKDTRDDSLLMAVTECYLRRGIDVCPATDFAPELLVKDGLLTKRRLSSAQQRDAEFGWSIAKQMGGLAFPTRLPQTSAIHCRRSPRARSIVRAALACSRLRSLVVFHWRC